MDAAAQQELERALNDGDVGVFKHAYEQNPQYRVRVCASLPVHLQPRMSKLIYPCQDEDGRTLLHLAIQHNLFDAIEGDISAAIVGARVRQPH